MSRLAAFTIAVMLTAMMAVAQVRSGRIAGTIADAAGSAVVGATVEVIEVATNQSYRTETNTAQAPTALG